MLVEKIDNSGVFGSDISSTTPDSISKYYKDGFDRKRKFKKRFKDAGLSFDRVGELINETETDLCTSLWRAVIVQALCDASGKGGSERRKMIRAESFKWFANHPQASNDNGPTDFEYVCEMANLNTSTVIKIFKEIRQSGQEFIDGFNTRTLRKDYSSRDGRKIFKKD